MPADFIITHGDMIRITIMPPTVVPALMAPVPLVASSSDMKANMMLVCLEGDELPPSLQAPLTYMSPPYVTPGTGTLSLTLTPTNTTMKTKNGSPILIKGSPFTAEFQVVSPAIQPGPAPVPDPVSKKTGIAEFITTNARAKAG
ncbi:MAG: hypothetical protein MJE77_08015 [Proteobacteria bacterium]|nr:hypothetical protein [Pseudomonadota bacterium]